ncbi:MAG: hypothetical protein ACOC7K_00490 [bacterium]
MPSACAEEDTAESVLKATCPRELDEIVGKVLRGLSQERVQELVVHADPAIAFAAAWERARRSFRQEESLKLRAIGRFLGFVEGRLCTTLPPWWRDTVADSRSCKPNTAFVLEKTQTPYRVTEVVFQRRDDERKIESVVPFQNFYRLAPKSVELARRRRGLAISNRNRSIILPYDVIADLIVDSHYTYGSISVLFGQEHVFVALHKQSAIPYWLLCLDAKNEQLIWRSRVWAGGGVLTLQGKSIHWVGIQEFEGTVCVFGVACECAYIEEFNTENGSPKFRFGTVYGVSSLRNRRIPGSFLRE